MTQLNRSRVKILNEKRLNTDKGEIEFNRC